MSLPSYLKGMVLCVQCGGPTFRPIQFCPECQAIHITMDPRIETLIKRKNQLLSELSNVEMELVTLVSNVETGRVHPGQGIPYRREWDCQSCSFRSPSYLRSIIHRKEVKGYGHYVIPVLTVEGKVLPPPMAREPNSITKRHSSTIVEEDF